MTNKVVSWKLHYEDGTVIEGQGPFPEDIPRDGCLGLVTYESNTKPNGKPYRQILTGADYYFCQPDGGPRGHIYGCDNDRRECDVALEISKRFPGAIVVRGKWTDLETMELIYDEIKSED